VAEGGLDAHEEAKLLIRHRNLFFFGCDSLTAGLRFGHNEG
jgi:hypothetical protein